MNRAKGSKYRTLWEQIKRSAAVTIRVHRSAVKNVKMQISKVKYRDKPYAVLVSADDKLEYVECPDPQDTQNFIHLKITLHRNHKVTVQDLEVLINGTFDS